MNNEKKAKQNLRKYCFDGVTLSNYKKLLTLRMRKKEKCLKPPRWIPLTIGRWVSPDSYTRSRLVHYNYLQLQLNWWKARKQLRNLKMNEELWSVKKSKMHGAITPASHSADRMMMLHEKKQRVNTKFDKLTDNIKNTYHN